MSADSQQIDITPYKVRRENVITTNQQRVWEPKPTNELASSILDKLTEIRGNLYPTHLNIPPHKSGLPQSATPYGYSYLSTSLAQNDTGIPNSGLDGLAKKDIYSNSDLFHSREPSATVLTGESLSGESSQVGAKYQSLFETTPFKNMEISHKTVENGTIPRIEMNLSSANHYEYASYLTRPARYEPNANSSNTEISSDLISQVQSPTYTEENVSKASNVFEHKNSSVPYSGTMFQVSDILKAGAGNVQESISSRSALYIPIMRDGSHSPDATLNQIEHKSNPTSTRATQTKVHINTSSRLPSVRKTPSRTQLINSLNEALKIGHNETGDAKMTAEVVQSRRLEKSVEMPKKSIESMSLGEKVNTKPKNKSTVALASIIGQNQEIESKRFSFGQLGTELSDGVPQSERSDFSQKDRDIQEFINIVSRNQVMRAQALNLKKKVKNATSTSTLENQVLAMKGNGNRATGNAQTSNRENLGQESQVRNGQGQEKVKKAGLLENQIRESTTTATTGTGQNKFQRDSRKALSVEGSSKNGGEKLKKGKRKALPLQNNNYEESNTETESENQFQITTKKDGEESQSEYSEEGVICNKSQEPTRRTLQFEDNTSKTLGQTARTKSRPVTINQLEDQNETVVEIAAHNEAHTERPKSRANAKNLLEMSQSEDKSSVVFTKSRPMTRNHLDETHESGLEVFQKNAGSRSGSSSPTRAATPETFLTKRLEGGNQQQIRSNDSPFKMNVISGRDSCIEKSVQNEDQDRSVERKRTRNVSESSMSVNKNVLAESPEKNSIASPPRTQPQQERNEKSEEYEQSESVPSGFQTTNRPSIERNSFQGNNTINQQLRAQRSPEMMHSSPTRQNPRMIGSPQVNVMTQGNMNNQMPVAFNGQIPANWNFQGQMPNFENDVINAEYQKHILMVMNFYEGHLNSMKNVIMQQNNTINQERYKNQMFERKNAELARTIQNLENTVKDQGNSLDSNQKELKTRYEVVMEELAVLKRTMLANQVHQEAPQAAKSYPTEGKEYQNLLYHEILSLRKDLEGQRSVMHDYRSSTRYLESQMKDSERMYMDEMKNNAKFNSKREQIQESLEAYKKDFIKMDTLNQILLDGYDRTRKDLNNNLKSTQNDEDGRRDNSRGRPVIVTDLQQNQGRQRRDLYISSLSPPKYEVEANNQEMLRNKMRAEDCQMKQLMQWNNKNETNSVHYVSHSYMPSGSMTSPDQQKQINFQTNSSQNGYGRRGYSPQQNQVQTQRVMYTDSKPNRSHAVFPSYQKMEDNREQIKRIDQTIIQLEQHKKFVENELFKMPTVAKSLEQKRKKAGLEMELEGIDNKIEDCKHQLRQFDVLNAK